MVAALAGIAISYAIWPLLRSATEAAPALFGIIMLGMLIGTGAVNQRDLFARIREAASPRELETTNPFSFVPLSSKLFVCIALFETTFGYATATRFNAMQVGSMRCLHSPTVRSCSYGAARDASPSMRMLRSGSAR